MEYKTTATAGASVAFKEATCIHTRKIYDSCKDKDCIEDLRFYPDVQSQNYIINAVGVRPKLAELLLVDIDVEPVTFSDGYYTVDLRFFYKIYGEAYSFLNSRADVITGLAVFDKRVLLYGGPLGAKVYSSVYSYLTHDVQNAPVTNLPIAVTESVDPVILAMKIMEACDCRTCEDVTLAEIPPVIASAFSLGGGLSPLGCDPTRRVYVSLGQFSIVRLERDTQILIPIYDYCLPEKECVGTGGSFDSDPCEIFSRIDFPTNQFFPGNYPSAITVTETIVEGTGEAGTITTEVAGATATVIQTTKPKQTCGCK
ncbi:MAG: hypothetical protein LBM98_13105 [Oscillospiraceae bacterium]|jgi:hypothetical protein|nr:hypothetical protein [Oscillospiraceae bacterium]